MPGWAIADAGFAVVLAFMLGVLYVLVRLTTAGASRARRRRPDDDGAAPDP
jgi:hypothetical protein